VTTGAAGSAGGALTTSVGAGAGTSGAAGAWDVAGASEGSAMLCAVLGAATAPLEF
jgi:hypothetical protein